MIPELKARPELVFGLVGAAGTRLTDLSKELKASLESFGYTSTEIRLSSLLESGFLGWAPQTTPGEAERIMHLQRMGNAFRDALRDGAALARAGIQSIRADRVRRTGNANEPVSHHAYILHQLKHPDEVELLRRVYGATFILLAAHAPRIVRVSELSTRMAQKDAALQQPESQAIQIIDTDLKEDAYFGQNTRDAYPKADFFANMSAPGGERQVWRFLELVFGHPFWTPSPDEYSMYQATAASLRSSDDSRQVGAAIVSLSGGTEAYNTRSADVIAVGMNEVPRGGGGFYWDGASPDYRDQNLFYLNGQDRAQTIKRSALAELLTRLRRTQWLVEELARKTPAELADELLEKDTLKGTQFMDIGEFSRPVHAEMSALLDAARRGVAVNGQSMYVTTFPCHNCAKHIIAAGLCRVVYLEPYPKSRAHSLYGEELVLESKDCRSEPDRVVFCAYSGIAPRMYPQLFSMSKRGAKQGYSRKAWEAARLKLSPMYVPQNAHLLYVAEEAEALTRLDPKVYKRAAEPIH